MVKRKTVSRLTKQPYWHSFAEAMLAGHNQADALRLARPQLSATWDRASIVAEASRLADDPRVIAHIEAEQAKRTQARRKREAALMDTLEHREICAKVARNDENNGLTVLAAVKTDAQLAGTWLERQEVSSTVSLSALLAQLPSNALPIARSVEHALPATDTAQLCQAQSANPTLPANESNALPCTWELIEESDPPQQANSA